MPSVIYSLGSPFLLRQSCILNSEAPAPAQPIDSVDIITAVDMKRNLHFTCKRSRLEGNLSADASGSSMSSAAPYNSPSANVTYVWPGPDWS